MYGAAASRSVLPRAARHRQCDRQQCRPTHWTPPCWPPDGAPGRPAPRWRSRGQQTAIRLRTTSSWSCSTTTPTAPAAASGRRTTLRAAAVHLGGADAKRYGHSGARRRLRLQHQRERGHLPDQPLRRCEQLGRIRLRLRRPGRLPRCRSTLSTRPQNPRTRPGIYPLRLNEDGTQAEPPIPLDGSTTTYVTFKSKHLPLVKPLLLIPGGEIVADLVEPILTVLVNAGYKDNQPIPQDPRVPRPMGLFPSASETTEALDALPGAVKDGVNSLQGNLSSTNNVTNTLEQNTGSRTVNAVAGNSPRANEPIPFDFTRPRSSPAARSRPVRRPPVPKTLCGKRLATSRPVSAIWPTA